MNYKASLGLPYVISDIECSNYVNDWHTIKNIVTTAIYNCFIP